MIIVPRVNLLDLLDVNPVWSNVQANSKHANLYTSIHYFIAMMQKSFDSIYRASFVEICMKILKNNTTRPYKYMLPTWFCPALLVGAIHLKDPRMCERIVDAFGPLLKVRSWEPFEYWISDVAELWELLDPSRPMKTCEDINTFVYELRYVCSQDSVSGINFDTCETGTTLEDLEAVSYTHL